MSEKQTASEYFMHLQEKCGGALETLAYPTHELIGREKELKDMEYVLLRPETPVLLLLGDAGVGKTALVEEFRKRYEDKTKKDVELYALNFGRLSAEGLNRLQERLSILIPSLVKYQEKLKEENPNKEVILFMDEIHQVVSSFGSGTKVGGDAIKPALARKGIKVIGATTRQEYDTYISVDKPLDRRFKKLEINVLPKESIRTVLRSWLETHLGREEASRISDQTIDYVIESNALYREQFAEPASSIDIFETAIAMHHVDNKPIDRLLINRVFEQLNIDLNYQINYQHVKDTIANQVKGQPIAIYTVDHLLKKITFALERSNKPLASALFVGTTGTGKAIDDDEFVPVFNSNFTELEYKRHGDLKVGDYVIAEDGTPSRVKGIYPNGKKEAFKIQFDDGSHVVCNDEHLFDVIIDGKRSTKTVKELQNENRKICLPMNHNVVFNCEYETHKELCDLLYSVLTNDDVSISQDEHVYCYHESSHFISQIQHIAYMLGIQSRLIEDCGETWLVFNQSLKDLEEQMQKGTGFARSIKSILPLHELRTMTCIEIEHPSHCYYVTKDFILTHNTQTVKALLEGLYGDDGQMINISMTDYKGKDAESRFRRVIGTAVRHNPNTIILLDEFEKCSRDVLEVMYPILDEGSVTFEEEGRDGYAFSETISLRNAIIVATTNAGQHLMAQDSKYGKSKDHITKETLTETDEELEKDARNLEKQLVNALMTEGIPDALIGRFDQIVPYFPLNDASKLAIAHKKLEDLFMTIKKEKGIEIVPPRPQNYAANGYNVYEDPITMFVVFERNGGEDSEQGGARRIIRTIDQDVYYRILDAVFKYPTIKRFQISTNGRCIFENPKNMASAGGDIVVSPI